MRKECVMKVLYHEPASSMQARLVLSGNECCQTRLGLECI